MKTSYRHSPIVSLSHWSVSRHAVLAGLTVSLSGALGCVAVEEAEQADEVGHEVPAGATEEQATQDVKVADALARKRAYLERGIVPAVPRELSPDRSDARFEFVGYANEATESERADVQKKLAAPADVSGRGSGERSGPLAERRTAGYLISSVGEIWRWKVTPELVAHVEALNGNGSLSTDAVNGLEELSPDGAEMDKTAGMAIIGSTDNRQVRSAHVGNDMTVHPWNAIGALNPAGTGSTSPNAQCTATKIGERHLLTAGHCVWTGGQNGSAMLRDWWPGQDGMTQYWEGGDPSPNAIRGIFWYWVAPGWFDHGYATEDYAVLVLHDSQGVCNIGRLGYRVDYSLAGTNVWMLGYPGWGNTCQSSDIASKSCRNSLWGMEENITRTEAEYIFYKHDQQEGQSGAPVYDYNGGNRQLVGIVKGEYTGLENRGIKITSGVYNDIQAVRSAYPSAYCSY